MRDKIEDVVEFLFITPLLPILDVLQEIYVYDVREKYILTTMVIVNLLLWAFYTGLIVYFGLLGLILALAAFSILFNLGK